MARRLINTKHFQVSKLLGEQIRFMSPGDMLPTVEELKQKYDCSQATVSQAIDRLRQQGLIEHPSGKKRLLVARVGGRPIFRVCLIRPLWSSPDYDSVSNRIYELGHREHFAFNVHIYSDIEQLNVEHALKNSDAGLVIGDLHMRKEQIDAFNGSRKPIVFLRDKPSAVKAGSVWVDDVSVGQLAADHLLKLGHKKIAVMLSEPSNPSSTARMRGWRSALQKKNIKEFESLIADCSVPIGKDALTGSYERFCRWLDEGDREFTALFCVSWTGALAAMRALRERSIEIPKQVSLITFASESPLCDFLNPAVTTVQIDLDRYTHEAMRLVRESLNGNDPTLKNEEIYLKPHVVNRDSTTKCPR